MTQYPPSLQDSACSACGQETDHVELVDGYSGAHCPSCARRIRMRDSVRRSQRRGRAG